MPIIDAAANAILDTLGGRFDLSSLHTAFPGSTGASEVSGGSYARQSITWAAAASRNLNSSNAPAFSVPATNTVVWAGFWESTPSPDTYQGYLPLKQAADWGPLSFQVGITANTIIVETGALPANDDRVVFYNGTPPTGLTEGTVYWVVTATAGDPDTFQVSATQGGAAIDLTATGSDDTVASQARPETFGSDGTYTLNDVDWAMMGIV